MTEAQLFQRWIAATDEVALAFAYEPDDKVDAELARLRQNLIDKFLEAFPSAPPETIAAGVDSIIVSVKDRKHEIEKDAIPADRSKPN